LESNIEENNMFIDLYEKTVQGFTILNVIFGVRTD